jgi:AraC-like DNA-binding protein
MRIELACQHLTQDDLTITEICYEIGFNNVSNFNRQFLLHKSMSPSKFRTLYREGMRLVAAAYSSSKCSEEHSGGADARSRADGACPNERGYRFKSQEKRKLP